LTVKILIHLIDLYSQFILNSKALR
jgi:hypothetical protein